MRLKGAERKAGNHTWMLDFAALLLTILYWVDVD
jgi:hypothetical protein